MRFILLLFLCLMLSFFNKVFSQAPQHEFAKAERIIKKMIRKKKVPGLAITVSKNNEILWSEGYGYAQLKKRIKVNPNETLFRVGSVSKPIAAVGLLKLVEEGKIALDSSIYNYLPYFPKKKYDFSVREIGGHLSGIRNYKGNEFKLNKPLSIKEGIDLFKEDSLLFKPGTQYLYTSFNWNLISLAIQEQAKLPFEDYIRQNILEPLNMNNTVPDVSDDSLENKAQFYQKVGRRRFKKVPKVHNFYKLAGGGYLSTAADLNTFGNALLNQKLCSYEQLKPFVSSQTLTDGTLTYYGIGFQASYDHRGRPFYGHVGNGLGGYGIFYVYPKSNVVITLLMNCSNPNQDKVFEAIIDELFKVLDTIPPHTP